MVLSLLLHGQCYQKAVQMPTVHFDHTHPDIPLPTLSSSLQPPVISYPLFLIAYRVQNYCFPTTGGWEAVRESIINPPSATPLRKADLPSAASARSHSPVTPQPLPYPCYNADWLDILQGLHRSHSCWEFMSTKARSVQKTPLTEVRFISGSHNPTTLPSAVFPELWGQQLRFPWFVIEFSWLFNYFTCLHT